MMNVKYNFNSIGMTLLIILVLNTNCWSQYTLVEAYPSLKSFFRPLDIVMPNDGTDRVFVVEQTGKIFEFKHTDSSPDPKLLLDLSAVVCNEYPETGLLGMALHPDFKNNQTFFLSYDTKKLNQASKLQSVISRFTALKSDQNEVIQKSEKKLLVVEDPEWNHNGGGIMFGPDGYLYFSLGDGGSANDPFNNSQNLNSYWGKLHRVDINDTSNGKPYSIPADNPFANKANILGEIYAYGLRNLWRFSFDPEDNHKIWAADVGQNTFEEIDIIQRGGNYGWKIMEGFECRPGGEKNCNKTNLINPVWTYTRSEGTSVTGGYVYRGKLLPKLYGNYVYADFTYGNIWALEYKNQKVSNQLIIPQSEDKPIKISSIAQDQNRELLFCSYDNGKIYRLSNQMDSQSVSHQQDLELQIVENSKNQTVEIAINLVQDSFVEINLLKAQGTLIRNITKGMQKAGKLTFQLDTSTLEKGYYFVKAKCNDWESLKKILVRKP